jgi:polyisoprenoid-binding protein YceI
MSSLDMGDADLTTTVSESAWLDAASFVTARFSSDEIVATRDGRYEAAGTLELKGLTQPVTVPFEWRRDGNAASMRGEVVLRRLDYGIGVAVEEVGNDVRVRFVVALRKD